jgi:hypothetical protein
VKWVPLGQLQEQRGLFLELQLIAVGFAAFKLGDDAERVLVKKGGFEMMKLLLEAFDRT